MRAKKPTVYLRPEQQALVDHGIKQIKEEFAREEKVDSKVM